MSDRTTAGDLFLFFVVAIIDGVSKAIDFIISVFGED